MMWDLQSDDAQLQQQQGHEQLPFFPITAAPIFSEPYSGLLSQKPTPTYGSIADRSTMASAAVPGPSVLPSASVIVVTLTSTVLQATSTLLPSISATSPLATPTAAPEPSTPFTVTRTATIIGSPGPTVQPVAAASSALHSGGIVDPTDEQLKIIWVAGVMLISLLLGWNMIFLKEVLYPWKMWMNAMHETCHILAGTLTGARVYSVTIDPDKGPISGMTGGQPVIILVAGTLGSAAIGSALIMSAFDLSASKVAALIVYPMLLLCFYFGRTWARIRVAVCMAVSTALFVANHAAALRYYILFIGVMNAFYVVFDSIDDFVFRKTNESDVALFARLCPPSPQFWALIWSLISLGIVALGILGGLHFFNKPFEVQQAAQTHFLPV